MGNNNKLFGGLALTGIATVGLFITNIIQAGSRKPDGRTMGEILGVDSEKATFDDIEKLNRADTMQLYYAADAPDFGSMKGEYEGRLLSGGVLGGSTAFFTNHMFPAGVPTLNTLWEGKAFKPEFELGGRGINIFSKKSAGGRQVFFAREMKTYIGPTTIGKDGKDAMHLYYGAYNSDIISGMHDEIRKVNDNLYICAGYMASSGGPLNPGPFVLVGPARPRDCGS